METTTVIDRRARALLCIPEEIYRLLDLGQKELLVRTMAMFAADEIDEHDRRQEEGR
jgi:hypothetical protein